MAMNESYLNATADHGGSVITHLGLVNETGTEITGGTYARQPVNWVAATGGLIRPTADLDFEIPPAVTVGGWRGFTALTGGTNHGGADVPQEVFTNGGIYTLEAALTYIDHDAAA